MVGSGFADITLNYENLRSALVEKQSPDFPNIKSSIIQTVFD